MQPSKSRRQSSTVNLTVRSRQTGRFLQPTATASSTPRRHWQRYSWAGHRPTQDFDPRQRREADIDRLADAVEQHMDLQALAEWLPAQAMR